MQKQLFVMVLVSGLVGCQSHIRPYDGVIGYQIQSQQPLQLIFTDEDRVSWKALERRTQVACQKALSVSQANIQILKRDTIQQKYDLQINTPIGMVDVQSAGSTMSGAGLSVRSRSINMNSTEQVSRPFKQLTVECQPKP